MAPIILVYHDEETGEYRLTYLDGRECENAASIVNSHKFHPGGLWGQCKYMGDTVDEIRSNIRKNIARVNTDLAVLMMEQAVRHAAEQQAEQAEQRRKDMACRFDELLVSPSELMQHMDGAERALEPLKPGEYVVCINYKRKGCVELRRTVRRCEWRAIVAVVEKEDSDSHAALHRFAVDVRKSYEEGAELIGRTQAINEFGRRLVDSVPHVKEAANPHYKISAPRRIYDRKTLQYLADHAKAE